MKRRASMDIGSNTIRLLVADAVGGGFKELHSSQTITRLGQGAHETGLLSDEAVERTLAGVESLLEGARHLRPFCITAAATHAVRKALNGGTFAELFEKRAGFPLDVIPQEKEAEFSLKGARTVVGNEDPIVLFDIGGGSTEFIYRGQDGKTRDVGTELGVVRLTETFIKHAPMVAAEYGQLAEYLRGELKKVVSRLAPVKPFILVGTAGTVTSIAAIIYNVRPYSPEKINNRLLTTKAVKELLDDVGAMTLEERSRIPALEKGREDLIIPGIGLTIAAMEAFGVNTLKVSDAGLREGVLAGAMEGAIRCTALE